MTIPKIVCGLVILGLSACGGTHATKIGSGENILIQTKKTGIASQYDDFSIYQCRNINGRPVCEKIEAVK